MADRDRDISIGPFEVATDARAVQLFAEALAGNEGTTALDVPHTFPITWLGSKEVQAELTRRGPPVQAFQSFKYRKLLAIAARYRLTARLSPTGRAGMFRCDAVVEDMAGDVVLEMQSDIAFAQDAAATPEVP